MSKTEAFQHCDNAKAHVEEAIEDLAAIIIDQCEGSDVLLADFGEFLKVSLVKLIAIRDGLGG